MVVREHKWNVCILMCLWFRIKERLTINGTSAIKAICDYAIRIGFLTKKERISSSRSSLLSGLETIVQIRMACEKGMFESVFLGW